MIEIEPLYTTEAIATGGGRNGHVRTADGRVDMDLAIPAEMGGSGDGANPEQLFAAGYAACFHQALKLAGGKSDVDMNSTSVEARVGIGPDSGSFGLQVWITATIPGADQETADQLVARAHELCPYSKATRGNIEVDVTATV